MDQSLIEPALKSQRSGGMRKAWGEFAFDEHQFAIRLMIQQIRVWFVKKGKESEIRASAVAPSILKLGSTLSRKVAEPR